MCGKKSIANNTSGYTCNHLYNSDYPPAIEVRVVEITYDCVSISIIICTANDTFPSIFMLNRKRQVIENSTINYQRLMYLSAVLKVYIRYVYVVIVVKAMILQRMY